LPIGSFICIGRGGLRQMKVEKRIVRECGGAERKNARQLFVTQNVAAMRIFSSLYCFLSAICDMAFLLFESARA
jgi:hypothetical protein